MEAIHDWALYAIDKGAPALIYMNPYASQVRRIILLAQSWVMPLLNQAINKPDLMTVVLLLVVLFLSLKILNVLWQAVLFWFRLARQIIFWGGLGAIGLWLWSRGPDGVFEDVQYWMQVWNNEHKYWLEQQRFAKKSQGQPYGGHSKGWY